MTSPVTSPSSRFMSSSLSSRLSTSDMIRTTTPSSTSRMMRRRRNSQIDSSVFDSLHSFAPKPAGSGDSSDMVFGDQNITTFQWRINRLMALVDFIEESDDKENEGGDADNVRPEALRRGIIIGEGWYKLDLARSSTDIQIPSDDSTSGPSTLRPGWLSLFITAMSLENPHYAFEAGIFVGIRPSEENVGRRFAPTQWAWHTSAVCEFSADSEYFECRLPAFSTLDQEILKQDSFTLCVQIRNPSDSDASFYLPGRLEIPPNIIQGLDGMFDTHSGDVKFVCLEHKLQGEEVSAESQTESSEAGEAETSKPQILSRKRVLYAHSEILKARGDYFKDLLNGGFSESEIIRRSDSRHTTITISDADFVTVYWMLKFIYTNQLDFASDEDVRHLMDQTQLERGEVTKCLMSATPPYVGAAEWQFRRIPLQGEEIDDDFDTRTVRSVSSTGTRVSAVSGLSPPSRKPEPNVNKAVAVRPVPPKPSGKPLSSSPTGIKPPAAVKSSTATNSQNSNRPRPSQKSPPSPTPTSVSSQSITSSSASNTTPKTSSRHFVPRHNEPDPHPHPARQPPAASALAIYMLAHRYRLQSLELLAKEQILSAMTAANCMPFLMASYQYNSLHSEILDFVLTNWSETQRSEEFLKCIKEVSAGTWGPNGGLVLHGLFCRLS